MQVFVLRWLSLHVLRWISYHVFALVCIDFTSNSQRDIQFHCIAYDYSSADWDDLPVHLRDVPCKDIFTFGASAAAIEFCEWVRVGIDVYIPHRKYKVKPHSSPWFSAACAATIVFKSLFKFVPKRKIFLFEGKVQTG